MRQVFISYSTKDQLQAEAVRNVIEQNGITCWMAPRDIPGGSNYTREIPIAIRGCQAFVLMLSQNAQNSHWVLKELDSAVNAGKVILPFQLEDITLTDEFNFLLTGAQRYDAYQKKAEALQNLVKRIKAIVDTAPQETPAGDEVPAAPPAEAPKPVFEFKTPEKKGPDLSAFDGVVCPACGSVDVQKLSGKIKARDLPETLMGILIPAALAVALPIAAIFLLGLISAFCSTEVSMMILDLSVPVMLAAFTVGIWLGMCMSKEWIRRRRIRSHRAVEEYRCNICRKQFLPGEK